MRQTLAILRDSLRELKSRSLFWISLAISVIVALALFGTLSFDATGWRILWFETNESTILREGTPAARDLLRWLFAGAFIWWWLSWGAIIIALISTASIIPDFVASGSIDLVLSKPIGRARLLLTKILGALLFMALQVSVGLFVAWLLMGLRYGMWSHEVWLAVPLLTIQFLYLFAFLALVGLITRSTLASLLAVLLFWAMVSIVQFASNQMDNVVAQTRTATTRVDDRTQSMREQAQREGRDLTDDELARMDRWEQDVNSQRKLLSTLQNWQRPLKTLEMTVPKTGDIQKIIAERIEAPTFDELVFRLQGFDPDAFAAMARINDRETAMDMQQAGIAGSRAARAVKPLESLGTSLACTALTLALCVWIFRRRDF
jgi:ABC-type transport system involved in multi-copper enzyme maturation permease subunit